jgi:uncharacterized protein
MVANELFNRDDALKVASMPPLRHEFAGPQIVIGKVMHRRTRPVENAFTYPTVFLRLPLSQLESADNRWFGINRFGILSFHTKDHGNRGLDAQALIDWARKLLCEQGVTKADGEIVLLTYPRLLGYVFNPVSFWHCYDRQGQLRAVIAEVKNTFGERHNYVVAHEDERAIRVIDKITAKKVFHVSPFCNTKGAYTFSFGGDAHAQRAQVNYDDGEGLLLATSIFGKTEPLTSKSVLTAFFKTPLMTIGVLMRIHWQAIKLLVKRVRFFSKPIPPLEETTR